MGSMIGLFGLWLVLGGPHIDLSNGHLQGEPCFKYVEKVVGLTYSAKSEIFCLVAFEGQVTCKG